MALRLGLPLALRSLETPVASINLNTLPLAPALKTTALTAIDAQGLTQVYAAYEENTEVSSPYEHLSREAPGTFDGGNAERE